jgi:hypothetical protein
VIDEATYERLRKVARDFDETLRRLRAVREARRSFPSQLLQRRNRFNVVEDRGVRNLLDLFNHRPMTIEKARSSPKMTFEEWLKASAETIEEHQRKHY